MTTRWLHWIHCCVLLQPSTAGLLSVPPADSSPLFTSLLILQLLILASCWVQGTCPDGPLALANLEILQVVDFNFCHKILSLEAGIGCEKVVVG